jgi:hypothetical protein
VFLRFDISLISGWSFLAILDILGYIGHTGQIPVNSS